MTFTEKQYVINVLKKEGIDYGLTTYTDFVEEVEDEKFHTILTSYNRADKVGNWPGKTKAIVELQKLLDIDIFNLRNYV